MSETAGTAGAAGGPAAFELFFGYRDEQAYAATVERLVPDRVASPHRRPGPDALGPRRRGGGRQAALLGRAARGLARRWSPRSRRCTPLPCRGLDHVVLCGMGGSSLAPEVICAHRERRAHRAGLLRPGLRARRPGRPARPDRRGGLQQVRRHRGDRQPEACLRAGLHATPASTPPNGSWSSPTPASPLEESARDAGYRVFHADPDVGGRYSALTAFGLVPSGLAGADIGALLDEAAAIRPALEADSADNPGPAARGPARRGQPGRRRQGGARRRSAPALAGFGDWAEQLIAESTGKEGKGILPVVVPGPSTRPTSPPAPPTRCWPPSGRAAATRTRRRRRAGAPPSTRRSARSCCSGSTPPRWPAG